MNVDQELQQVEANIRKLQQRANLLRRVRETPPEELIADFHNKFRQAHRTFLNAFDAFRAETASLFHDLVTALGYSESASFEEWVAIRGEVGRLFHEAQRTPAEFASDTRTALLHEARKELEMLFLELEGKHAVSLWFEHLLRNEGLLEEEADEDESDNDGA